MEIFGIDLLHLLYDSIVFWVVTGGGVIAFVKSLLWVYGARIVSYFRIYKHRNDFLDHKVFYKIDHLLTTEHLIMNINDVCKKEIARELLYIEMFRLKQVLVNNLRFLFKTNVKDYIEAFPWFQNRNVVKLFIDEYLESKAHIKTLARNKLTRNNSMSQDDFNRLWLVYCEYTAIYEIVIYEALHIYPDRKNIYGTLWDLLDQFSALVETITKTLGLKLNLMNGRLDGIAYNGYIVGRHKGDQS